MTVAGAAEVRKLRTAVIGTGFVGPHHVDAIRRTGYADVDVIVGSDRGRTERRAVALGIGRWSTAAYLTRTARSHRLSGWATNVELPRGS